MTAQNFGTALGDGFVLNEATLMIGALGSALDLTEEKHSFGLFKNMAITNDKTFQPLNQGVRQETVHQTLTADNWTLAGNGYEYNPRTIMYALGQAGYTADPTVSRVKTTVTNPASTDESTLTLADVTGLKVDDWIVLSTINGNSDGLAYKIKSIANNAVTLDRKLVSPVAVGDKVVKSTLIMTNDPDSCSGANYYSAKIVSADVNCNPIVIIVPKIQITSGLNLTFGVSDYANMGFQATPMALTRKDAGYDWYAQQGKSKVVFIT
ncbi:MAG: hypothetical protein [Caudoviricetes sp.]|nr:MAG: hypothetical protein [Caudoviricetes sp.]